MTLSCWLGALPGIQHCGTFSRVWAAACPAANRSGKITTVIEHRSSILPLAGFSLFRVLRLRFPEPHVALPDYPIRYLESERIVAIPDTDTATGGPVRLASPYHLCVYNSRLWNTPSN